MFIPHNIAYICNLLCVREIGYTEIMELYACAMAVICGLRCPVIHKHTRINSVSHCDNCVCYRSK